LLQVKKSCQKGSGGGDGTGLETRGVRSLKISKKLPGEGPALPRATNLNMVYKERGGGLSTVRGGVFWGGKNVSVAEPAQSTAKSRRGVRSSRKRRKERGKTGEERDVSLENAVKRQLTWHPGRKAVEKHPLCLVGKGLGKKERGTIM